MKIIQLQPPAQSNEKGTAPLATLSGVYPTSLPTLQVWNGPSGFLAANRSTNTNQWPEQSNTHGIEYKLGTLLQAHFNDTIYWVKPARGSYGLHNGAGSAGTYDPLVRGVAAGILWDVAMSAWNEALNALFQTDKNDINILPLLYTGLEADAKPPYSGTIVAKLTAYITKCRLAIGKPNHPFVITKLSSSVTTVTMPDFAIINAGIDTVCASMTNVVSLVTDGWQLQGDATHYTSAGFETAGQDVFNCYQSNGWI